MKICVNLSSVFALLLFTGFFSCLIAAKPPTIDSYPTVFVRANQLGYRPADPKRAIAFSRTDLPQQFSVVDTATQRIAVHDQPKPIAGGWGEFDHQVELNFSALQESGRYFLRIGEATSRPFEISVN